MIGAEMDSNGDVALFQYGSNMSHGRLQSKVKEYSHNFAPEGAREQVRVLGPGRMSGWRFTLDLFSAGQGCLVADIITGSAQDQVWGVVYKLDRELVDRTDGRRSVLDRIEGHRPSNNPENYRLCIVRVELGGAVVSAITYAGTEDARRRCRAEHHDARVGTQYATPSLTVRPELTSLLIIKHFCVASWPLLPVTDSCRVASQTRRKGRRQSI